jgi:hypothetical protein
MSTLSLSKMSEMSNTKDLANSNFINNKNRDTSNSRQTGKTLWRDPSAQSTTTTQDTKPTQCDATSINQENEGDEDEELDLSMKIAMVFVGIAGLSLFVAIGTFFFEEGQVMPFNNSYEIKEATRREGDRIAIASSDDDAHQHQFGAFSSANEL